MNTLLIVYLIGILPSFVLIARAIFWLHKARGWPTPHTGSVVFGAIGAVLWPGMLPLMMWDCYVNWNPNPPTAANLKNFLERTIFRGL